MSEEKKDLETSKFYNPFIGKDAAENRLKLKPTSKYYVRDVCDVQAKRISLSDQLRCQYADQAGYKRHGYNTSRAGKRKPIFELQDVYDEFHVHAAMAQAMFYNCPKLIEVVEVEDVDEITSYEIKVIDEELFGALDEGVVNQAFLAFSAARSGIRGVQQAYSATANPGLNGIQG